MENCLKSLNMSMKIMNRVVIATGVSVENSTGFVERPICIRPIILVSGNENDIAYYF